MTSYDSGDIVLVRYPFTDLNALKKRPAIVLSQRTYSDRYGDLVVMPLTSREETDNSLALSEWRAAGLLKPTWVKPVIGTLILGLVDKQLGKLAVVDDQCIRAALSLLLDIRWTKS